MEQKHHYQLTVKWTGNTGTGTSGYRNYERSHAIEVPNKPTIEGSSDPDFRGDNTKHNPEQLFLAAISSCHMLWYLHVCADAGIIVTEYEDAAKGTMQLTADGGGKFTEVILQPLVIVTETWMITKANELHAKANALCFIANSLNFPVLHTPTCSTR